MVTSLKSKIDRQIIVYTTEGKNPNNSYPLPPRSLIEIDLTEAEIKHIKATYKNEIIIFA